MTIRFPVHPFTGLAAIGFRRNGDPIWPIKGGSGEGDGEDVEGGEGGGQAGQGEEKSEIDWKAKSREWERKAKANADAAKRLAAIEEANKSEAQKLSDAKTAAERDRDAAKAEALRLRIATKHGISDEDADLFLTGTDEATLTRQAERLAQRSESRKKQGNHVPREGNNQHSDKANSDMREFTRNLFGNVD